MAIPPLGCGNGGLEWSQVRREIELALSDLEGVTVLVFAPTSDYQNTAKREGLETLTPARSLVAELVRRYSVLGLDCTNLEVQKLAWFMQRVISKRGLPDPLDLNYTAHKFGPYADNLRHLLNGLDGSYLHCEKRLSDAGPLDLVWFDDSRRSTVAAFRATDECQPYRDALEETAGIIDGFESPLGMELLATVDWIAGKMRCELSLPAVKEGLNNWPGGADAALTSDRRFVAETVLAFTTKQRAQITILQGERKSLERDLELWQSEINRVLESGDSSAAMADRLAAYETRVRETERTLADLALQQQTLGSGTDEATLEKALKDFDPVWNAMPSRHQKRVLQLLIRQIDYDGATGKIAVTFHQHGFEALADNLRQRDNTQ